MPTIVCEVTFHLCMSLLAVFLYIAYVQEAEPSFHAVACLTVTDKNILFGMRSKVGAGLAPQTLLARYFAVCTITYKHLLLDYIPKIEKFSLLKLFCHLHHL